MWQLGLRMATASSSSALPTSYPDFLDWQRNSRSFEQVAAFLDQGFDLTSPGEPEHLGGTKVSSKFFRTLGENLAIGRELYGFSYGKYQRYSPFSS